MASMASPPVEQQALNKPSFAKVASSSYKPHITKEINATTTSDPQHAISSSATHAVTTTPQDEVDPTDSTESPSERRQTILAKPEDFELHSEQWSTTGNSIATTSIVQRRIDPSQPARSMSGRQPTVEEVSTRLSSSGDSAKPPSLDGKSVASGTTFALDEKESLRPDDSASLRAADEDGNSPPGSTAADSRMGSDVGAARAFSEQLREIGTLGPAALRGAPPGRLPPGIVPNGTQFVNSRPLSAAAPSVSAHMTLNNGLRADYGHTGPLPDEKLLEALESQRDRVWVLKLEQDLIDFVKDPKECQLSLPSCNAFYRMLAHKLADYYILAHTVDESMTGVRVSKTEYCRIPPPLLSFSSNNGVVNTPPIDAPTRKIMRRGEDGKATSGTNTTANSDGPSNATSVGSDGDSDGKGKQPSSHEVRMAKYNEVRQRIFGQAADAVEQAEGVKADENDTSRSSSASGKKTKKKSRNYDDEEFESRAHFNAYPPQAYPAAASYQPDSSSILYGQYASNGIPQHQYSMMPQHVQQPMTYENGYQMQQEASQPYVWQGQVYQQGQPLNYGVSQPMGYDLSAEFQRGMQSFQSAPNITPQMPKASPVLMGGYQAHHALQHHPQQSMAQNWTTMPHQSSYQPSQNQYQPQGSPMNQASYQSNYAYGQLPAPSLANGKQNKNQHPLPGSYNRNQFNPQIQAFIPGGRASFSMQAQHAQMTPPAMHSYPSQSYAMSSQGHVARPSPPQSQQSSAFASPHFLQNIPSTVKPSNGSRPSMLPQPASTSSMTQASNVPTGPNHSAQSLTSNESSIAKWGTPSHLPPKPPPPASIPPPKFSLPGQNHPAAARLPAPAPVATATGRHH
ncbi:hypothetical protein EJ05DRAFT_302375 [Pseudovirgaria hyperparasitica]|uniref:R3H domain-containing protein n=1 Tax=Pseudovirgaria hyperparasitica TaxID=470096 RepID=A0A6A6W9N3_9PEZI|nr:uncharacterized protein EJ05DRAFT_302375 [Pseudovirgaria hyperparasitica]KAF2759562.1 hypothetical protein EJ05DRAFT_302375 [Pseudovirgaria hyperparasitica]